MRTLPNYKICSVKIPLELLDRLCTEAKAQERSLAGEVTFRLRRSFDIAEAELPVTNDSSP
jgi:hypothetical protein